MNRLPLVDAHCHGVATGPVGREDLELWCTEASVPPPVGTSYLDGQLGFALRRWCAPVIGAQPGAPVEVYLERRAAIGAAEASRRLLAACGLGALLVDTGLPDDVDLGDLGAAAGAPAREVVRLERVAERVAATGVSAAGFADAYAEALGTAVTRAVAVKSILAYRYGLDIDPARPGPAEVTAAAGEWLRTPGARLTDPVLLRHLLWCGVDTGLPVQLHTGFGDRDVPLARSDPALLQPFCAAVEPTGTPLVLLHCYPYHRQAGWLALVYPHVYLDVGLTITHLGARADAVLAEFFELAPVGKVLYASDAYLLPELYLIGAAQFRHSFGRLLGGWVDDGALTGADARRVASMVGADNARRLYRLD
ncbi:amidohydrolase family protein [Planosporangium thailandense]|uniref:Amidohydrolase family protein n=1 Tax=Planosporangium thailandense TaxID=765197 RepID=A0ABX0Y6P2_9ACTN|nr:amidohydrolase family protein [Planosporangium thailandense]